MQNKGIWIILTIIIVGFIGLVIYSNITAPPEVKSSGSNNTFGKIGSSVTVTEFVDFQCEACYAYYPAVKQVKEKYKDTVLFQVKYFPIEGGGHPFSRLSAKSAQAAAVQGKFWEMHDKIFQGQKTWEVASNPQQYYDQYAKEIGLDMAKFEQDRKSELTNAVINGDKRAAMDIGVKGTPAFVVNGKLVDGPGATVDALSKMIDNAIKDVRSAN